MLWPGRVAVTWAAGPVRGSLRGAHGHIFSFSGETRVPAESDGGAAGPDAVLQPLQPCPHGQDDVRWLPGGENRLLPGKRCPGKPAHVPIRVCSLLVCTKQRCQKQHLTPWSRFTPKFKATDPSRDQGLQKTKMRTCSLVLRAGHCCVRGSFGYLTPSLPEL